jgi:acetyl-CoA C-acetyltransferase
MTHAYILAAHRTAVAPVGGAFNAVEVHDLAAPVIRQCLRSAGLEPSDVDELILSNALGGGGNPARLAALAAGLPEHVAGLSIDRQCVGGLDAVTLAARLVQSGAAHVVIAGGAESYSRRPLRMRTSPDGKPPVTYDRPPFTPWPDRDPEMHAAADVLAKQLGITREAQDEWAIQSHAKALAADFSQEVVILNQAPLERDAFARKLTSALCARAKRVSGDITSANAAVAADAAAFAVVVSEQIRRASRARGARIMEGATLGDDPTMPGAAPIRAIRAVLDATGTDVERLSRAEIMEAYAAQAIACVEGAGLDPAITNTGGGALARGHPIGASGAILAVRLFHELQKTSGTGLAAIAAAGGLGSSLLLQA